MNTASKPMYEWKTIPWGKVERVVFKLQKRIYQASERGDRKTVHKLQRLLMKSWYARLLATRRVTQDNQGKKAPGMGRHPEINDKLAGLLKKQQGQCAHCGLYFKEEDILAIANKKIALTGKNRYRIESKLLHKHCHDKTTKTHLKIVGGTERYGQITEEPSQRGDPLA